MDRRRPDPDELLEQVASEDRQAGRGRLTIFLGYVAGVGKTYAMLGAAHERSAQGVDVVVGLVETHGRADTDRLLDGLEIVPRRTQEYRGTVLTELDLDAVLKRAPRLALVDELAHTNVPGSRHPKRYQDVEELLDAGIDVYTTLNVQHLESYNDVVAQITGVRMHETVPDLLIDEHTEFELVDLPPDELLQRLEEGKVYVPEQAARAVERFFRPGNLSALRELALRRAAQQVDARMLSYMQSRAIAGPWPAGERLLVSVGPSPLSARLVRTTKRLADELRAEWLAVYVEVGGADAEERGRAEHNLAIARRLGGRVVTLSGQSVADTITEYARRQNVTRIVAGKPHRHRWKEVLRPSPVDDLIRKSGPIDVYVVNSGEESRFLPPRPPARPKAAARTYLPAVLAIALATLIGWPLTLLVEPANVVMIYMAAVILVGVYLGRGPALLAAALGVLTFDFFLVPPRFTFAVSDTHYILTFAGLFIVGLVVSTLAARQGEFAQGAQRRERETAELYELSRELTAAVGVAEIAQAVQTRLYRYLGEQVVVLLKDGDQLRPAPGSADLESSEQAVAQWVADHGLPAGPGTDTLPGAQLLYLPLLTPRDTVGILGVRAVRNDGDPSSASPRVTEAAAALTALALERAQLVEAANELEVVQAGEELRSAVLNSISHELRTPLVSILGTLDTLRRAQVEQPSGDEARAPRALWLPAEARSSGWDELVEAAWGEAERLNRIVGTLLDMSRLETGIRLRREEVEVEELVGSTLALLEDRLRDRNVCLDLAPNLPLLPVDPVLLVHALVNVLDNAIRYSPPGSPVDIEARTSPGGVVMTIADRGVGIPEEELGRVFEKFHRLESPVRAVASEQSDHEESIDGHRGGLGLGLSITKGIVEAHGGLVRAERRAGGGTVISIALPTQIRPEVGSAGSSTEPSPRGEVS